jgi:hypothetical protein
MTVLEASLPRGSGLALRAVPGGSIVQNLLRKGVVTSGQDLGTLELRDVLRDEGKRNNISRTKNASAERTMNDDCDEREEKP